MLGIKKEIFCENCKTGNSPGKAFREYSVSVFAKFLRGPHSELCFALYCLLCIRKENPFNDLKVLPEDVEDARKIAESVIWPKRRIHQPKAMLEKDDF